MQRTLAAVAVLALACGCGDAAGSKSPDADNTAVNSRDADNDTKTPFDQSNDQADIDLVAKIRSQVVDIDDLSVNGQNVKIITNEGRVLLRGPVKNEIERDAIVKVAEDAAGAENVTNQLEIEKD